MYLFILLLLLLLLVLCNPLPNNMCLFIYRTRSMESVDQWVIRRLGRCGYYATVDIHSFPPRIEA